MVRTKRGDAGAMLSGNIRATRQLHGMTQERLAKEAEISLGLVAKLEQGRWTRSPDALTLARIARALGVSLDTLLGLASPESTANEIAARRKLTISLRRGTELIERHRNSAGKYLIVHGRISEWRRPGPTEDVFIELEDGSLSIEQRSGGEKE